MQRSKLHLQNHWYQGGIGLGKFNDFGAWMSCWRVPVEISFRFFNFYFTSGTIILGDPGAVSRAGGKGATKVFKHRRKSPWIPTLTGPFPNGQVNAGSWLGTKNALYYCAQSRNSISWVLFVSSYMTRQLLTWSRLVWLMHQTNARSQETFSLI